MTVGEKIKELRIAAGVTQEELAKALGAQPQTVINWELGIHKPAGKYYSKLAYVFDIDFDILYCLAYGIENDEE